MEQFLKSNNVLMFVMLQIIKTRTDTTIYTLVQFGSEQSRKTQSRQYGCKEASPPVFPRFILPSQSFYHFENMCSPYIQPVQLLYSSQRSRSCEAVFDEFLSIQWAITTFHMTQASKSLSSPSASCLSSYTIKITRGFIGWIRT